MRRQYFALDSVPRHAHDACGSLCVLGSMLIEACQRKPTSGELYVMRSMYAESRAALNNVRVYDSREAIRAMHKLQEVRDAIDADNIKLRTCEIAADAIACIVRATAEYNGN